MAVILHGTLTAPHWGCTDEDGLGILLIADEATFAREETLLANGQSDVVHAAYHGANTEKNVQFKVQNTGFPASGLEGATIALTDTELGGTFIVREVSNVKNQGEFMGGNMILRTFPNFSLTTTTTTTTTTL